MLRNGRKVSIREAKAKISAFMTDATNNPTFTEVYHHLTSDSEPISPAISFLTVLHLTNEHGWRLVQQ